MAVAVEMASGGCGGDEVNIFVRLDASVDVWELKKCIGTNCLGFYLEKDSKWALA